MKFHVVYDYQHERNSLYANVFISDLYSGIAFALIHFLSLLTFISFLLFSLLLFSVLFFQPGLLLWLLFDVVHRNKNLMQYSKLDKAKMDAFFSSIVCLDFFGIIFIWIWMV